jgi:hypothetical protein
MEDQLGALLRAQPYQRSYLRLDVCNGVYCRRLVTRAPLPGVPAGPGMGSFATPVAGSDETTGSATARRFGTWP